ncbi:MAG: rhodanese-like domain-containing protein, partial [Thermomonas sp.]
PAAAAEMPVPAPELAAQIAAKDALHPPPLILDVRTPEEFDAGHVPGAVLIPEDQLATRIGELGTPREVVVYCRTGHRSGLAEPVLENSGFRVHQLAGSWQAWQAAGLPEEKSVVSALPDQLKANRSERK